MNKKYLTVLFIFLLSIACPLAAATTGHRQDLIIVKYGLSTDLNQSTPDTNGNEVNNLPADNNSNQLIPIAGIHYQVQQIVPRQLGLSISVGNTATYRLIGSPINLVTTTNGQAQTNLADGYYIVTEEANPTVGLLTPAAPLLLTLPATNRTQIGSKGEVYIYPKSNINTKQNETSTNLMTSAHGAKNQKSAIKLPKTGSESSNFVCLVGFIFVLCAIFFAKTHRERSARCK